MIVVRGADMGSAGSSQQPGRQAASSHDAPLCLVAEELERNRVGNLHLQHGVQDARITVCSSCVSAVSSCAAGRASPLGRVQTRRESAPETP